jgi:hypothetical protein
MRKVTWICLAFCLFWGTEVRAQAIPLSGTLVTNSVINTGRVSGQDPARKASMLNRVDALRYQ